MRVKSSRRGMVASWAAVLLLLVSALVVAACASGSAPITSTTASTAPPSPPSTASPSASPSAPSSASASVFAVIGDYGTGDQNEAAVARLVASWDPAYIVATGDDYYSPAGGTGTGKYDDSTGAFYARWLKDITTSGTHAPVGLAPVNAFFPCLGNHDYSAAEPAPQTYLTYFDLPGSGFKNTSGNERYYDFVEGPIHFFAINSNDEEPDGTSSTSTQAQWLQRRLAASTSTWNVVFDHHPPYSSDLVHGSDKTMQWPFAAWGADVVLSGHAHAYERVQEDGIVYFVNGLGGAPRYALGPPVAGSQVRYDSGWGAQKVFVSADTLTFEFWSATGQLVDSYSVRAKA
jgi:hypothetical protein